MKTNHLGAYCVSAAVLFAATHAFADEPAGGNPELQVAEFKTVASALEPESTISAVGSMPNNERSWLAPARTAQNSADSEASLASASAAPSLARVAVAVILLGLVAAALYLRKRRSASPVQQAVQTIKVLSAVRVGPKAQVVATEVAGRVMLLGVTESSIEHLAWLDEVGADAGALTPRAEEEDEEDDFTSGYGAHAPPGPKYNAPAPGVAVAGAQPADAARAFRETLGGVWQRRGTDSTSSLTASKLVPQSNSVAQLLAYGTKDIMQARAGGAAAGSDVRPTTTRRPKRAPIDGPIESQVAGLMSQKTR